MQECLNHIETLKNITSQLQKRAVQAQNPSLATSNCGEDKANQAVHSPSTSASNFRDQHHQMSQGRGATANGKPHSKTKIIGNGLDPDVMQMTVSQIREGFASLDDCDVALLCDCPSGLTIATWLKEVLETLTEMIELKENLVAIQNRGRKGTTFKETSVTNDRAAVISGDDHDDQVHLRASKQYLKEESGPRAGHSPPGQAAPTSADGHDAQTIITEIQNQGEKQPVSRAENVKSDRSAAVSGGDRDEHMTCTSHIVDLSRQGSADLHD